jgi:HlyD family secretion protein
MLVASCGSSEKEYDATGVFEATEVTVSAEQSGQLVRFDVSEGDSVGENIEVGLIDTTQIALKIAQADASKAVYQSQKPDMEKLVAATRQQLEKARQEQQRYKELVNDGAAPRKMLDDAVSQVKVLEKELAAQISSLSTQTSTLNSQLTTVDVQVSQLLDQLRKCHVITPAGGTVLEKYAECGEFVTTGKPLFRMADTGLMFLRAYITSQQLQSVKPGQRVKVFADYGGGQKKEYDGVVSWISSRSEFTPKTILTDDERADLVYAVKIAVRNDGGIKIGMYGEVSLAPAPSTNAEKSE